MIAKAAPDPGVVRSPGAGAPAAASGGSGGAGDADTDEHRFRQLVRRNKAAVAAFDPEMTAGCGETVPKRPIQVRLIVL